MIRIDYWTFKEFDAIVEIMGNLKVHRFDPTHQEVMSNTSQEGIQ